MLYYIGMKVFAVLRDKNSLMTYTYGFVGTKAFLARVLLEKCELCLTLDDLPAPSQGDYATLKGGDTSVLPSFVFEEGDTSVRTLFYTENQQDYDEYVAQIRIDDLLNQEEYD